MQDEPRWQAIVEALPQIVWTATTDGRVDYVSPRASAITGVPSDAWLGLGWLDLLHPDEQPQNRLAWSACVAGERAYEAEYRLRGRDGAYRWFSSHCVPVRDDGGRVIQWAGMAVDVTERKAREERAQESIERFDRAMKIARLSYTDFALQEDGLVRHALPREVRLWAKIPDDAPAMDVQTTYDAIGLPVEDRERNIAGLQACVDGVTPEFAIEVQVRRPDGEVRWRLARGIATRTPDGKATGIVTVGIDITDLKRAQEETRRLAEELELACRWSKVSIWTVEVNAPSAVRVHDVGQTRGHDPMRDPAQLPTGTTAIGDALKVAVAPHDIARVAAALEACVRGETPELQIEYRAPRNAEGIDQWRLLRGRLVRDADGSPLRVVGTRLDITELRLAQEETRRVSERLELAVRASRMSVWSFDLPQGALGAGHLYQDTEIRPTEDYRDMLQRLVAPVDCARVTATMEACIRGETSELQFEYRALPPGDRGDHWRLAHGTVVRNADGTPLRLVGTSIDITELKRAESALRESEERFRGTFENAAVGMLLIDPTSRILAYNETFASLIGCSSEESLIGRSGLEVMASGEAYRAAFERLSQGNATPFAGEREYHRKDGSTYWAQVRASIISRDETGKPVTILAIFQDITERKVLEREAQIAKDRLELGLQSSNLSIFDVDMPDGTFRNGSRVQFNLWESLGYTDPPEGFDETAALLLAPTERERVLAEIERYLSGAIPRYEIECQFVHADGSPRWQLARGVAIRREDGTPVRFIGSHVDITAIKQIESELLRARETAESANRAKDEFLANVSHEIRTPMNAILGMTELALDSSQTDHQRQLLSTVKSAAKNLLGIIDDLLDFSKITAGKLALDDGDFSLRAALGDTVRALAARAHRKGLELVCHVHREVPDLLVGDAGRLRQVLMNLVGNALKFTTRGEVVVDVAVDPHAQSGDGDVIVTFTVRDTGVGIAREKHEAIFRAFEQEDSSTTRKYGGTGLGLTISAQLATLMGGEITVESEPGRGSTFRFTARFARSSKPEWNGRASLAALEGASVLVVDDNETNRLILEEWLTNWRMRPIAVGNAAGAFAAIAHADETDSPFALVLLDARMPDVDGIALAGLIRERSSASSKRFILLSSDDSPSLAARSHDAGIQASLLKPLQQSELLETIWAVMNAGVVTQTSSDDRAIAKTSQAMASSHALRVLVAEDNELNVAVLEELLSLRRYRSRFANDGRVALAMAAADTFDLLLLDLHMPEMDGFEVVGAIRERERTTGKHLPIIALTARSSKRDRERALAAGMDDFLSKPIETDALWAAVDRVVAAFPPAKSRESRLLDASAILRVCGGRPAVLEKLCEVFRQTVPEQMARVQSAFDERDWAKLRESVHKLFGTLAAFSTVAGAAAESLEDSATREDVEGCSALVERLDAMCSHLLDDVLTLTIGALTS
jgi:two-component system, sensor histidine kinase and response regulator